MFEIQENYIELECATVPHELTEEMCALVERFFANAPVTRTHIEGNSDEGWIRFLFEPALGQDDADRLLAILDE